MKDDQTNHYSTHQDVLMLLPWYVNKTLSGEEQLLVEKHLKVCLSCRHEINNLQKLSNYVHQVDTLESAAQNSFSQLQKRIHQTEKNAVIKTKQSRWFPKLELNALFWQRSAIALFSVLFITILIPRSNILEQIFNNQYHTLSDITPFDGSVYDIRVVFKKGTNLEHINKILEVVNGEIIEGPSSQGVYSVRIKGNPQLKSVEKLIKVLRKNTSVVFAEPNYHLLSSTQMKESTNEN